MAEKSIITSPISEVIGDADSIFINKDGALMQITKENLENAITEAVNATIGSLNTAINDLYIQANEKLDLPTNAGIFQGNAFSANEIRFIVPLPKNAKK